MKKLAMWTLCASFLTGAVLGSGSAVVAGDVIVPNTSKWKWLHPTDGKDPADAVKEFHKSFMKADFDDSKWQEGADKAGPHGGFGYGEDEFEGVDIDQPDSELDRKTAYFRHKFKTDKELKNLVLKCQRDDGLIIYLDGKEVARDNVGDGEEAYDLFAENTVSEDGESESHTFKLADKLDKGEHVIAISLHNRAGGSSDLRIGEISIEVGDEKKDEEKKEDK